MSHGNIVKSALAAFVLSFVSPAVFAQAQSFDVPAGDLSVALDRYIQQTGAQLIYRVDQVKGIQSPGAVGEYEAEDALSRLLVGTDFVVSKDASGAMAVANVHDVQRAADKATLGGDLPNGLSVPAVVGSAGAEAIEPGVTESVTSQRRGGIEEIIVTARKREESVQDVPISITALSSEDMKIFGIRNVADMEGIVPGLNMGGGGNGVKKDSNPFIRGVGQRETKVTLDPGVGTYIDGIYIGRPAGGLIDIATVQSVEVLRGPQGTLFGRNTTGGAISITTKKPTNDWGAEIGTSVGNYGRSDVMFSVNAPIIKDTLLSRLTVSSINSEGYFTNVVDNTKWGDDNRITGIGQLRWLAGDSVTVDVLGERTRIRERPRPQKCAVGRLVNYAGGFSDPNYFLPAPIATVSTNARLPREFFQQACQASDDLPNDQFASDLAIGGLLAGQGRYWVDTSTLGLTATWDIGELGPLSNSQFKNITAWRKVEQIADEDLDATGLSQLMRIQPDFTETTQISEELQLTGSALNERLFFSTGLYYFQEKTPKDDLVRTAGIGQSPPFQHATNPNHPANGRIYTYLLEPTFERLTTDNETYAWYGQIDFNVTDSIQLTAGLRYTEEERFSSYGKGYAVMDSIIAGTPNGTSSPGSDPDFDGVCIFQCNFGNWDGPAASQLQRMVDWNFRAYPARSFFGLPVDSTLISKSLSTKDEAWTPMVSVKYSASADVLGRMNLNSAMLYLTYSKGFHSGGVTAGAIDTDAPVIDLGTGELTTPPGQGYGADSPIIFKPEYVHNYEIGAKIQALDRRVQANIAIFYMDYKDMQITSTANRAGVPIPQVENVGKSVIQGVEAEFILLPTPDWRVVANAAWTDADMKEWNANKLELDLLFGNITGVGTERRDDEPMPRVPEWQAFLLTDYTFRLPGGSILTPSIAARYSSEIYHGFDRGSFLHARDVVTSDKVTFIDARIPWVSADGKMEIAAWVKNLTNIDDYLVGGIPLVDVTGAMGQVYANPRTFGLNMAYHFGTP